jgi:hypothetical protein
VILIYKKRDGPAGIFAKRICKKHEADSSND